MSAAYELGGRRSVGRSRFKGRGVGAIDTYTGCQPWHGEAGRLSAQSSSEPDTDDTSQQLGPDSTEWLPPAPSEDQFKRPQTEAEWETREALERATRIDAARDVLRLQVAALAVTAETYDTHWRSATPFVPDIMELAGADWRVEGF